MTLSRRSHDPTLSQEYPWPAFSLPVLCCSWLAPFCDGDVARHCKDRQLISATQARSGISLMATVLTPPTKRLHASLASIAISLSAADHLTRLNILACPAARMAILPTTFSSSLNGEAWSIVYRIVFLGCSFLEAVTMAATILHKCKLLVRACRLACTLVLQQIQVRAVQLGCSKGRTLLETELQPRQETTSFPLQLLRRRMGKHRSLYQGKCNVFDPTVKLRKPLRHDRSAQCALL